MTILKALLIMAVAFLLGYSCGMEVGRKAALSKPSLPPDVCQVGAVYIDPNANIFACSVGSWELKDKVQP
jgi:hypothetical protein